MGQEPNDKQISNLPEGLPDRVYEAERVLQKRLAEAEKRHEDLLVNFIILYGGVGRLDLSTVYLERLLQLANDAEKKANCFLMLGQTMEQTGNYEEAIQFYKQALVLEPTDSDVWYLVNNNLGYCLNYFSKYADAEPYCREAIKLDPGRYNAYKNLGISLQGLGTYTMAARSFIKAVEAEPRDNRAFRHLLELMSAHPEIAVDIPDIHQEVERCRKLVQNAGFST